MNKTVKIILSIAIVGLVVMLGYFFAARETNIFSPTPKVPASISFQETGEGCGDIFVYKINKDDTAGISVGANKDALNLSTTAKTFEIEEANISDLSIKLRMGKNIGFMYCNDAIDPNQPEYKTLLGKTGEVTISISKIDESQQEGNRNYTATVILKNIHFVEENGNNSDVVIDKLIFRDIRVGWWPG